MEATKPTPTKPTTTTTTTTPPQSKCLPTSHVSNFQNQQGGGFQKKDSMEAQFASVNASLQQILQLPNHPKPTIRPNATIPNLPTKPKFASERSVGPHQCTIGEREAPRSTIAKPQCDHASTFRKQYQAMSSGDNPSEWEGLSKCGSPGGE